MIALLLGCASEAHWAATRAACGLADGETAVSPLAEEGTMAYDADCARAVGDDFGVRWEMFPDAELPGAMDGDPLERFLAGAWMLLAGDFGDVADYLADPLTPASFAGDLGEVADALAIADDAPAARLLYEYASNEVAAVDQGEAAPGFVASLDTTSDTLLLRPTEASAPNDWMGTVIHEAAHARGTRPHAECQGLVEYDDAWDGTWGVEALMVLRWGEHGGSRYPASLYVEAIAAHKFCTPDVVPEDLYARVEAWP